MKTKRAFMIDAMIRYLVENNRVPYILVDIHYPGVSVPLAYAKENTIILNLTPAACANFMLNDDGIFFSARFNKVSYDLAVPLGAILVLYDRADPLDCLDMSVFPRDIVEGVKPSIGRGATTPFFQLGNSTTIAKTCDNKPTTPPRGKPVLKLIKGGET